jgi:hypothetical protein
MTPPREVAPEVTCAQVEEAFPWVRQLPRAAADQLVAIIDNYHAAAEIYSRKRKTA